MDHLIAGPLSRRDVVRLLAAGVAGSALLPHIAAADKSAGHRRIADIGLQLYTVRDAMKKDLEGTLDAIAKAGITQLEFAGYYDKDAAWWAAALKKRGLKAPSTHEQLPANDDGWDAVMQRAKSMGHELVVVPFVTPNQRGSKAQVQSLAKRLNVGAQAARKAGLLFAYHNHDFEFAPLEGTTMWDILTAETDASLVKLELDCYWATKAGKKPLDLIQKWPGRIVAVHVKDATAAPEYKMTEVGAGVIDYKSILAKGRASGLQWWFIEHDQPTDAIASITASAAAMKKL